MRAFVAAWLFVLGCAGCQDGWNLGRPRAPAAPAESPSPAPSAEPLTGRPVASTGSAAPTTTSAPADSETPAEVLPTAVMATVNGRPIYMKDLLVGLLEARGLPMAELLVHNAVVEQEAARLRISVTTEEVAAENERSLKGMFGEDITADQRRQVLERLLNSRGLTRPMWDATMRRNALLRKMAEPRVTISEPMLQAEFARQYGEKVLIRHIQAPTITEAQKILDLLKEGKDFEELARKYSTNTNTAGDGGALPPFARENASVPRAMREAAFALKVGQVSGIVQVGEDFHVLRLEQRFNPPQADYERVKDKLRQELYQTVLEHVQREMLSELRQKADVEYVNPILRKTAAQPAPPP